MTPEEQATLSGNGTQTNAFPNLLLQGVSQTADPAFAGAYIAETGKDAAYYRIGDALPGNAGVLSEIASDHVLIRHNGVIDALFFADGSKPAESKEMAGKTESASPFHVPPPEKTGGPALSVSEIAQQFASDPQALLAQAGLQPVAAGQTKGYQFNGQDEQGVFEGTGMQKDDVLLGVNGTAVGDPKADRTLIPKLLLSKSLKLDVQRGDMHVVIDYVIP